MEPQLALWTMALEKLVDLINIHGDAKIRLIVFPSLVNQFLFFYIQTEFGQFRQDQMTLHFISPKFSTHNTFYANRVSLHRI